MDMQTVNHQSMSAGDDSAGRRACDQCRHRKIRCDKDWPCSNCRTAKRSCTSTGAGQRPKEARQRVLISSQYERKIDRIENRLGNIEHLLKNITSLGPNTDVARVFDTPQSSIAQAGNSNQDDSDDESAYEGENGLSVHTALASEFLESAVKTTSLRDANPNMDNALNNLHHLVEMQKKRSIINGPRFPLQKPVPPGGLQKLPMPPISIVSPLLQRSKNGTPTLSVLQAHMVGIRDFASLCRVVYFPSDDFTESVFIIVNSGLSLLFMEEMAVVSDPAVKEEFSSCMRLCQANLETALANMRLFMAPKPENIQAMLYAATYAIDMSRPSLAWHLISNAVLQCQTGGYHRAETMEDDSFEVAQLKKILFWNTYILEKGLSLRLGRASGVMDFDISIPRQIDFTGYPFLSETAFPNLWLRTALLQAQIYEYLYENHLQQRNKAKPLCRYSPKAIAGQPPELEKAARSLADQARELVKEDAVVRKRTLKNLESLNPSSIVDVLIKGDEVQLHSTMTLIYQAIPAPPGSGTRFCEECLESARRAMIIHKECMAQLGQEIYLKIIYIHWSIMFTPFAPFFVLFCYVIETSSPEDLQLLREVVESLEMARNTSLPADKFYRLCHVLADIAGLYVQARSQQQDDQERGRIGVEFDIYLSQLGFLPGEDHGLSVPQMPMRPTAGDGQMAHIAEWYSGSRNMMSLLEEDFSGTDNAYFMDMGPGTYAPDKM